MLRFLKGRLPVPEAGGGSAGWNALSADDAPSRADALR